MHGDGGVQDLYQLIYADRPDHIRCAGAPWAGVARAVEQTMAVLDDGRRKLAKVWRSPAGTTYLAEMDRVVEAMRATSQAARHNGQVMDAAADALNGIQKDVSILTTAPVPDDARERFARAIVSSLDDSYQQAIADFHPVPIFDPNIEEGRPFDPDKPGLSSSPTVGSSGRESAEKGSSSKGLPSWVPTQPSSGTVSPTSHSESLTEGPRLQSGTVEAPTSTGGHGEALRSERLGRTGTRGPGSPTQPSGDGRIGAGWPAVLPGAVVPGRMPATPGQPRVPGGTYPAVPTQGTQGATQSRAGHAGQRSSMVGGVPVGGATGTREGSPGWCGYRRPSEQFPTSRQYVAPQVITPAVTAEPRPDQVSTDYTDEDGNRITIRRPHD